MDKTDSQLARPDGWTDSTQMERVINKRMVRQKDEWKDEQTDTWIYR